MPLPTLYQCRYRGGATGSKGQLITCVIICTGVLIAPLYPSYLAMKVSLVFFIVSNTGSSPAPFVNDFLGYHLADIGDLGQ